MSCQRIFNFSKYPGYIYMIHIYMTYTYTHTHTHTYIHHQVVVLSNRQWIVPRLDPSQITSPPLAYRARKILALGRQQWPCTDYMALYRLYGLIHDPTLALLQDCRMVVAWL